MNTAGGLSFQEAIQEALAEETAETVAPEVPISDEPSNAPDVPETEQPAIENLEEVGLFDDLSVDEVNEESNQLPKEELLTIEIEGRQWTFDEVRAGVLMKADYTRKTQELSAQRQENDKAIILWDALHGGDAVKVVENLYRTIAGQAKSPSQFQPQTQVAPAAADIEALIESKLQERLASDPRLQALEQQEAFNRLEVVFAQIEQDNDVALSDKTKMQILQEASASGTDNLDLVYNGMMRRLEKVQAARDNVKKNATTQQRRGDGKDEVEPESFSSWREAMDDSLRQEGILDTAFNF